MTASHCTQRSCVNDSAGESVIRILNKALPGFPKTAALSGKTGHVLRTGGRVENEPVGS